MVTRRSYGFLTYEAMEVALYHTLGRLPRASMDPQFLLTRPSFMWLSLLHWCSGVRSSQSPPSPFRSASSISCRPAMFNVKLPRFAISQIFRSSAMPPYAATVSSCPPRGTGNTSPSGKRSAYRRASGLHHRSDHRASPRVDGAVAEESCIRSRFCQRNVAEPWKRVRCPWGNYAAVFAVCSPQALVV